MAKVRKRTWKSAEGAIKTAWVADYFDQGRKRHIRTFERKKDADKWLMRIRPTVGDGVNRRPTTPVHIPRTAQYHLYRHYDASDKLLYVGRSLNSLNRLISHEARESNTFWFDDIATITIEHFTTKDEVEAAEYVAINEEHPRYNIQGGVRVEARRLREFALRLRRAEVRPERNHFVRSMKRKLLKQRRAEQRVRLDGDT